MQAVNPLQRLFGQGGEAFPIAMIIGIVIAVILVSLLIQAAICWFLSSCFSRIPAEYRKQEPGLVWLLLVPCLNLVWVFFVFPKLAESFQAYFQAQGRTDVGDCGYGLGMAYAIGLAVVSVLGCVPLISLVNCLLAPALLVLLILFLVKAANLKAQIPT